MQVNLYCFIFYEYEVTKENGMSLVRANSVCPACAWGERMQPCLFQQAAHIPTALGAGDAVQRSVANPRQHQKWKMLVSGLSSDSQSLS